MKKTAIKKILKHEKIKDILLILLLTTLGLIIVLPFFREGYIPTHDGEWAVVRLGEMFREVRDGQIPPRYSTVLNFGHGYPLFNFAYPFPYYLGLPFIFLGFGFIGSIKAVFVSSTLLSGIGMYLAAKTLWGNRLDAFTASLLFLYLPYRIVDLYVRGSIGETVAFAAIPFALFAGLKITKNKNTHIYIALLTLALLVLITSHNIMALFFVPTLALLTLFYAYLYNREKIKHILFSFILGVGSAAFFWLPAIVEKQHIVLSQIPIADRSLYFVSLLDFALPSWGYGTPTGSNAFTYQLGWPHLTAFITSAFVAIWKLTKKAGNKARFTLFLTIIWLAAFALLFEISAPIWEGLPLLKDINYPWTLISVLGFLAALAAGYIFTQKSKLKYVMLALILLGALHFATYAKPQEYIDRGDDYYLTNDATTTSSDEYTPLWVEEPPTQRPKNRVEITKEDGVVDVIMHKSNEIRFTANLEETSQVRINTIYYPTWQATRDGENVEISYDNKKGVMEIELPEGEHNVTLEFRETPLRLASNIISVVSIVAIGFLFIYGVYNLKKR